MKKPMSLEERISRLEERMVELLLKTATLNDQYDELLIKFAALAARNERLEDKLKNLTDELGFLPEELDQLKGQFNLNAWVQIGLLRQTN
jgi:chromosome segregation ATPase